MKSLGLPGRGYDQPYKAKGNLGQSFAASELSCPLPPPHVGFFFARWAFAP